MKWLFAFFLILMASIWGQEKVKKSEVRIITKAPCTTRVGGKVHYVLVVKNMGAKIAKNVFVRTKIPIGMKYVVYNQLHLGMLDGEAVEDIILRWNIGPLSPKQSKIIKYSLIASKIGAFKNIAIVYVKGKGRYKSKHFIKVLPPLLEITIFAPRRIGYMYRRVATLSVEIFNKGNIPIQNLKLVNTLPRELSYINSSPRGVYRQGNIERLSTITWKISDIQPGKKKIIKFLVKVKFGDSWWNKVELSYKDPVLQSMCVKEGIFPIKIWRLEYLHLSSYKIGDHCEVGKKIVYIIECMNEGTSPFTMLRMRNRLPKEMEFVEAKGPTPHKYKNHTISFEAVPSVEPGEKLTYIITCKAITAGSVINRVILTLKESPKPVVYFERTNIYQP